MRPSKQKTPLAKLRALPIMLKTANGKKVRLSRQDLADWLGCGVDNISSIESGRVELTRENAEIIMHQTGVKLSWLLGKNNSPFPIHWSGRKYTQKDFDDAQKTMASPSFPALQAQLELSQDFGIVATILLHAVKKERLTLYATKLRRALWEIMAEFEQEREFVNLGRFIDMSPRTTIQGHDLRPMQKELERQLLQIVGRKMKIK